MNRVRWVAEKLTYNQDNEVLQTITVHAPGEKKEQVKREHGKHHRRNLLVREGDSFRLIR